MPRTVKSALVPGLKATDGSVIHCECSGLRLSRSPQGLLSPLSTLRKAAASLIASLDRHSTTRTPNAGWAPELVTVPVSTTLWSAGLPVTVRPFSRTVNWGVAASAAAAYALDSRVNDSYTAAIACCGRARPSAHHRPGHNRPRLLAGGHVPGQAARRAPTSAEGAGASNSA